MNVLPIIISTSIQLYLKVYRNVGFFFIISWVYCTCLGDFQNCICDGLTIMFFGILALLGYWLEFIWRVCSELVDLFCNCLNFTFNRMGVMLYIFGYCVQLGSFWLELLIYRPNTNGKVYVLKIGDWHLMKVV